MRGKSERAGPDILFTVLLLGGIGVAACGDDSASEASQDTQDFEVGGEETGTDAAEEPDLPLFDVNPQPGTGTALTAGGGQLESSGFRLTVAVGDHGPVGVRESTNYQLRLGVVAQVARR